MSWLKRTNLFKKKGKDEGEDDKKEDGDKDAEKAKEGEDHDDEGDKPDGGDDGEEAAATDENFNEGDAASSGGGDGQQGESSTPTPDARSGTAGSMRSRMQVQPTLVEDSESEHDSAHAAGGQADGGGDGPNPLGSPPGMGNGLARNVLGSMQPQDDDDDDDDGQFGGQRVQKQGKKGGDGKDESGRSSDDDDSTEDDDDDVAAPPMEGMYDPSEYENLNVSPEIKELFQFIMRYTPQTIDLETRFKPFIPEYIPAVGDIDAFIKVPRPDNQKEALGLTVLDEPAAKQSDPSVLELQLRAISKQSSQKAAQVKKIESGEKNNKEIDKWIKDISDLHRSKPPPTVHYSKPMPDIDTLMQEWPPEVEEMLKETGIPTAEFDCDIATYVDVVCSMLDIPVYKSRIQSLHVLFSLYSAFRNSQHFNMLAQENNMDNVNKVDRMEFE